MAHDIFISYSTKDKNIADAICNYLEKNSIRCWIAPRDVLPGKNWGESIVDAITEAKILVLILSSNSNQSSMVMRELERAVSTDTTVIPFRVEEVDPSKQLEFFIAGPHWLDALTPPLEKHIDSLTQTIGKLLNNDVSDSDTQDLDKSSKSSLYNKIMEPDLSLSSPIVTIIVGLIAYAIFSYIFSPFRSILILIMGPIIGGFIATYFSKEKKVRYAIYLGIILMITFIYPSLSILSLELFMLTILMGPGYAIIGGILGKIISNQMKKRKYGY